MRKFQGFEVAHNEVYLAAHVEELLRRVCNEWVNGRRVLDGIVLPIANEIRAVIGQPSLETPVEQDCGCDAPYREGYECMNEFNKPGVKCKRLAAVTNGGMKPTCPNCGHEPCAEWCGKETPVEGSKPPTGVLTLEDNAMCSWCGGSGWIGGLHCVSCGGKGSIALNRSAAL